MGARKDDIVTVHINWTDCPADDGYIQTANRIRKEAMEVLMGNRPIQKGIRYPDSEDCTIQTFLNISHDLRSQRWVVSGIGTEDEYSFFLLEAYSEAVEEAYEQCENDGLVQTPTTILDNVYKKLEGWGRIKFHEGGAGT